MASTLRRSFLAFFSCGQIFRRGSAAAAAAETNDDDEQEVAHGVVVDNHDDDAHHVVAGGDAGGGREEANGGGEVDGVSSALDRVTVTDLLGLPKKFQYAELVAATGDFQVNVGKGGFGTVFKGELGNRKIVAVKRVEAGEGGSEIGEVQFLREIAAIASIQHFNLARLLGYYYVPAHHRYLVYEFVENRSLESWIFSGAGERRGEDDKAPCLLNWGSRYQVAFDVAKALRYLHHDCRERVLHLDIKPENILINRELRAKLGDFGLSTLMGKDKAWLETKARGTYPYMSPDFILHHDLISEKSDVYSYGMVLFELVHGRRNVTAFWDSKKGRDPRVGDIATYRHYPEIVGERFRQAISGGSLRDMVDPALYELGEVDEKEVRVVLCLALLCTQEDQELRPTMADAVDILEWKLERAAPPGRTLFLMLDLAVFGPDSLSQKNGHSKDVIAGSFVRHSKSAACAQPTNTIAAVHGELSRQMLNSMAAPP